MKKIYTLIAATCLAFGATAQNDFAITLVTPTAGSTDASDPVSVSFEIENVGTTTVPVDSVLWCSFGFDGAVVSLALVGGEVSGFLMEEPFAPGDVFPVGPIDIDWLDQTEPTDLEVCAVVYGMGTSSFSGEGPSLEEFIVGDDDVSNNTSCFTAELPVAIDDTGIENFELALSNVYVLGNQLMIVNDEVNAEDQANLNIINVNGQIVQSENFVLAQGTTAVGINALAPGIYIVAIEVEGGVVTRKISIQ